MEADDEDVVVDICEACEETDCVCCSECGNAECTCCSTCEMASCMCCSTCDEYPCDCCSLCEYPNNDCRCCGDCCEYPCCCSSGHGYSEVAPWVRRGQHVNARRSEDWKEVWPEIDTEIDPVIAACDFYLLEALTTNAIFDFKPTVINDLSDAEQEELLDLLGIKTLKARKDFLKERLDTLARLRKTDPLRRISELTNEASRVLDRLIYRLDESFTAYTHIAVAGEIRHHICIGAQGILDGERGRAWSGWRDIYEKVGNQALLDLEELFHEFEDDAYGGPKWAGAAKILYQRLEGLLGPSDITNKKIFVDRIFSMQHNGGQLLNKVDWKVHNVKKAGVDYLSNVLDRHASEPPDILFLYRLASPQVQSLTKRIFESAGAISMRPEFKITTKDFLDSINADPFFICRSCNSNPRKGHFLNCRYINRVTHSLSYEPNGSIQFNSELFRMRWEESELPSEWHDDDYAVDHIGSPLLLPEDKVTIGLYGYFTAGDYGSKTFAVSGSEEIALADMSTLDFTKLGGYDPKKDGKICSIRLAYTISRGNYSLQGKLYEHWNAHIWLDKFNYKSFKKVFLKGYVEPPVEAIEYEYETFEAIPIEAIPILENQEPIFSLDFGKWNTDNLWKVDSFVVIN